MGTFGFGPPDTIEISIELNTMITNATTNDDVVVGLTYTDTGVPGRRNPTQWTLEPSPDLEYP